MATWRLVMQVELSMKHRATGATRHYQGNRSLPIPSRLQIAKFPDESGYYLVYLDANGDEMTDTYHDSVGAAMAQANREFRVEAGDWDELPAN